MIKIASRWLWVPRTVLSLVLLASAWHAYSNWRAARLVERPLQLQDFKEAIRWAPNQHQYHFRLGILYRDQLGFLNLQEACTHLQKACDLNPYSWQYWLELGRCYEFAGRTEETEQAYRQAVRLNPRSSTYRWRLANFYLRLGKGEQLLEQIVETMRLDAAYREPSLALLWQAGISLKQIEKLWPKDHDSLLLRLKFLVRQQPPGRIASPADLHRYWDELRDSRNHPSVSEGLFYIEYLLQRNLPEARKEWVLLNRTNDIRDPDFEAGRNLLWNGNFEQLFLPSFFDWEVPLSETRSFEVRRAEKQGESLSTALQLEFKGTENLNFNGPSHRFFAETQQTLEVVFWARSENLTTEQGVFLEISEVTTGNPIVETPQIRGTTSATVYRAAFRNAAPARVLRLQFKRRPSRQIDNKIKGIIWIDSVAVRPG